MSRFGLLGGGRLRAYGPTRMRAFSGSTLSAPAAPTNLAATPAVTSVGLTWTASGGATTYNVYRGTSSGGETLLASGQGGTSYTDTTATPGTTYYYEITAVNGAGESPKSNEVNTSTPGSLIADWPIAKAAKTSSGALFTNGQYLQAGASTGATTKLSISTWVRINGSTPANAGHIGETNSSLNQGWFLQVNTSGGIDLFLGASGTFGQTTVTPAIDVWTHVVAVYDGTQTGNSNRLKIWQNGVQQTLSFTGTIPASISVSGLLPQIGTIPSVSGIFAFAGNVGVTALWNGAISSGDVATLWNNGAGCLFGAYTGTPPLYWWNLTELSTGAAGVNRADSSGNSNTMTDGGNGDVASLDGPVYSACSNNSPITVLQDQSSNAWHLYPDSTTATNYTKLATYSTSGPNGQPSAVFTAANTCCYTRLITKPSSFTTWGVLYQNTNSSYYIPWGSCDNGDPPFAWGNLRLNAPILYNGNGPGSLSTDYGDGTNSQSGKTAASILPATTWSAVASRFNSGDSGPFLFFNNTKETVTNGSGTATTIGGTNHHFSIGREGETLGEYLDGQIAEVAVYSAALTDGQVTTILWNYAVAQYGV